MWKRLAKTSAVVAVAAMPLSACGEDEPTTPVIEDAGASVEAAAVGDATMMPAVDASDGAVALDVAAIMARLATCKELTTGKYKTDANSTTATVPICGLKNAVFWQADMDIDCDGKLSAVCNKKTDPSFLNQTSGQDSNGDPLDAATLPFVVVPLKSTRFDYSKHGLAHGSVFMVVYKGKYQFGVFGDLGPAAIIGEASYAMAKLLGIDPDPAIGGTDSGVTYIGFTGPSAVIKKLEDQTETARIGDLRARQLLAEN